MAAPDLAAVFAQLQAPPDSPETSLTALPINGFEQHRLARDTHGAPALLVAVTPQPGQRTPTPYRLEHISVLHAVPCVLTTPGKPQVELGTFTVIRCSPGDIDLATYFLHVLPGVLEMVGPTPTGTDVSRAVLRLVELFQLMGEPPRTTVQGLWAELLLIVGSTDSRMMAASWHATPEDRYDFTLGGERIEVKSAAARVRKHHFSLEQLHPPEAASVLVASLFVERSTGGTTLQALINLARHAVATDPLLAERIDRVVADSLGNSWRRALESAFDQQLAEASLAFYDASKVPSVDPDLPPGVSGVSFTADLGSITPEPIGGFAALGKLYAAAVPHGQPASPTAT